MDSLLWYEWQCPKCQRKFVTSLPTTRTRCKRECGYVDTSGEHFTLIPSDSPRAAELNQSRGEMSEKSRLARYASALYKWQAAGCPTRTDQQVLDIYNKCCAPCPLLQDGICTHRLCGCRVKSPAEETESILTLVLPKAMMNKLRMATEDCPWLCRCSHSKWKHLNGPCSECECQRFRKVRRAKKTTEAVPRSDNSLSQ